MRLQNPYLFGSSASGLLVGEDWLDVSAWGGTLMITAYLMGTLYNHKNEQVAELSETYNGILMILRHFISNDTYTENHSWRVSIYAMRIAAQMGFDQDGIEDVRASALLHDIGKLDISLEILHKDARLTEKEFAEMKTHVAKGAALLEPVDGSLRRILPIVLGHHDKFDGSGYNLASGEEILLEARVISLADAFDAMTADRPYRAGTSPYEAREILEQWTGKDWDPKVAEAFMVAFRKGEMEAPSVIV